MATSAAAGGEGTKKRPIKERFDAAVSVIRSLPKEGSFQISNTVKLRFYALFKQANHGPCNISKPAFWDATGRAKWEAWTVCGNMRKETAMQMYVEELQSLVETMPQSKEVEQFIKAIGPFFEFPEEQEEKPEEDKPEEDKENGEESQVVENGLPIEDHLEETGHTGDQQPLGDERPVDDPTSGTVPLFTKKPSSQVVPNVPGDLTNQIPDEQQGEGASGGESDEDFQESFQDLPKHSSGSAEDGLSSIPPYLDPEGHSSQVIRDPLMFGSPQGGRFPIQTGAEDVDGSPLGSRDSAQKPPRRTALSYRSPRLLTSTDQKQQARGGGSGPVHTSILREHRRLQSPYLQRAVETSAGKGKANTRSQPELGDALRDGLEGRRSFPSQDGGDQGSFTQVVEVSQNLPLALQTVMSQLQHLQHNMQGMVQQLNTLAMAVHGLTQLSQQDASESARPPQLVTTLVPRRRGLLQRCLRAVPMVVVWPVTVSIIMTYLGRRYGTAGAISPPWMWGVFSLLQVFLSLYLSSARTNRYFC